MRDQWRMGLVWLLCILFGHSSLAAAQAANSGSNSGSKSSHIIELEVLDSGDILVHEQLEVLGDAHGKRTRSFILGPAPGAWPLLQRIDDVTVTDSEGNSLDFRQREYEERANVDFLEWPQSGDVHLRYRVHRALDVGDGQVTWRWTMTGHTWSPEVVRADIRLRLPKSSSVQDVSMRYWVFYEESAKRVPVEQGEGGLRFQFQPVVEDVRAGSHEYLWFELRVPNDTLGPVPSTWFFEDLAELFLVPGLAFVVLLILAVLQLFFAPGLVLKITRISNFVPMLPAFIAAFGATQYWYFEAGDRSSGNDLSGEFIVNFGLAGFVAIFAFRQYRILGEVKRAAYFAQLAFPAVLLVAWPISFVDRSMLVFPLLALPVYLYWLRRRVALEFGVGAHEIAEAVAVKGEMSIEELATLVQMKPARLRSVLVENASLPVVVDHKNNRVYSTENAAMHSEFRVCTYCGGATETVGMAHMKCGHCDREYMGGDGAANEAEVPIPVVIESIAIVLETLCDGMFFFAGVIGLAIFVMETVAGDIGAGAIGAVIGGGILTLPGFALQAFSSRLRQGKAVRVLRWIVLLGIPLVAPFVLWLKLRSRRVRLFTSEINAKEIENALGPRGEWSLAEFAHYLQSNQEDAAELASYLVSNHMIDAVYDRRSSRLVSRQLYRQIAKEGDCKNCGGFYGVVEGKATCHYCDGLV